MRRPLILGSAFAVLCHAAALAQSKSDDFADPAHFGQQDGAALYHGICQGCHMPAGQGAVGAGAYPALARDAHLATAGFAVLVVLNGSKAMPGFAPMLSDAQVAAVVNYIRGNFGNAYSDAVTPADIAAARQ